MYVEKTPISQAAFRCVTLEEAKLHLRVDNSDEDDAIETYLDTAIESCEAYADRCFQQRDWLLTIQNWPSVYLWETGTNIGSNTLEALEIPLAPLVNVTSVKYRDVDDVLQTVDPSNYVVGAPKSDHPWISFTNSFTLPTLSTKPDPIEITVVAGYDQNDPSASVSWLQLPRRAKSAILLEVGHLYANRESVQAKPGLTTAVELPRGVKALLDQLRIYR